MQLARGTHLPRRSAVLLVALAGCSDERLAPAADLPVDVAPVTDGTWYRPAVATTWQWQLAGEIDTAYDVEVYDVDLFDVPPATVAELHAAGRRVICYFSAGSSEDWRPDYGDIDRRALGEPLDEWEGERWLDVRAQSVADMVVGRLDLAVAQGCDGVEPDNVDGFANDTGFELDAGDQLAFNRFVANAAHERGLAVGLKNDGEQVAELLAYFDFELNEQCHEYDECGGLAPFPAAGKPVFNAEYAETPVQAAARAETVCPEARAASIRTLILPLELDDSFRVSCELP